jgi:hypothetical protein
MTLVRASLATLVAAVRTAANLGTSQVVTDTEIAAMLNDEYAILAGIVDGVCEDYRAKTATIAIVPGTMQYALPDDFHGSLALKATVNSIDFALKSCSIKELQSSTAHPLLYNWQLRYAIVGQYIQLSLPPVMADTLTLWYIPEPATLATSPSQGIEAWCSKGWERWVTLGAAIKCLVIQESDPSGLQNERDRLEANIRAALVPRDQGETQTIRMEESYRRHRNPYNVGRIV